MHSEAQWIWLEIDPKLGRTNQTVLFRRHFHLRGSEAAAAVLQVTADSRYRAFVNGEWVGDGPVRAYPQHWRYDEYALAPFVRTGDNLVEVYVQHFGTSTFHTLDASPGLLAAICCTPCDSDSADPCVLITDATWEARPALEYVSRTPRVSCQQDFEEQVVPDRARAAAWQAPTTLRSQTEDTHQDLKPRDVRPLGRIPVFFKRVVNAEVTSPLNGAWSIKLRETLGPAPHDANIYPLAGVYAAEFEMERSGEIEWNWLGPVAAAFLDGAALTASHAQGLATATVAVGPGRHLLSLAVAGPTHENDISIGWRTEHILCWDLPENTPESPWICVGPLWKPEVATNCFMAVPGKTPPRPPQGGGHTPSLPAAARETVQALATARDMAALMEAAGDRCRRLQTADVSETDVYLNIRSDRLRKKPATVTAPGACLTDNTEATLIEPDPDGDVRLLLDLDDLTIGWFEMKLTAPEGAVVDGYFFENRVDAAGAESVIQHTGTNHNTFRLTCRAGTNHFLSRKRRGMRYALLTFRDLIGPVQLRSVHVVEATYPVEFRGGFTCSDARLNRAYEISRRTLQLCMEDVFTDCPLYEQTLWIGDARNEAIFANAAFWTPDLVWRCCRLGAQSLESLPIVGCQVPSGWDALLPAWSFLWGIMVWEAYFYTGDRTALEELYPAALQNLRNAMTFCTDHGLFSGMAWNMFDWTGADDGHNTVLHNSLFLVGALEAGQYCAEELGYEADTGFCRESRSQLVQALEKLWDAEKRSYPDSIHGDGTISDRTSQHTSVLALLYDAIAPANRAAALANVLEPPREMVRVGSPFALFYFLEALEKEGEYRGVMDLIRRYWGAMLDQNARTCWETVHFESRDFPTRSHCHGWSAAPVAVLPRMVLGVFPTSPGFRTARVRPQPLDLTFARGSVPTPYGDIRVNWAKLDSGQYDLKVEAPPEVSLEIDRSGFGEE